MIQYLKYCFLTVVLLLFANLVYTQNSFLIKAAFLLDQGKYNAVINELKIVPSNNKDASVFYDFIGKAAFETGDFELAKTTYHKRSEFDNSEMALYQLSRLAFIMNNRAEGYEFLRRYLLSDNHISYKKILVDNAFEGLDKDREWIRFWSEDWFSEIDDDYEEAGALIAQDHANDELFDILQLKYADESKTWSISGRYYEGSGDFRRAKASYIRALELNPNSLENIKLLAQFNSKRKKYAESIELITRSLEINPYQATMWMLRINIRMKMGDNLRATTEMQYLESTGVESPDLWISLAKQMKFSDLNSALSLLDRVIKEESLNIDALNERALLYCEYQSFDNAFADWAMSLDADPSQSEIYYKRGDVRYQLGDSDGACHDWKKAFRYGHRKALDKLYKYCE